MENLDSRRWMILSVVTLVSFLTNLDATIVLIGLAKLMEGLNLTIVWGVWTITAYMIANTVLLLPAGRWSDMIGTKRIFITGLTTFTVGTILCGITDSGFAMILYRAIQGIGAALAQAMATPIIIRTFPKKELGLAIGINSTSWVLGAIVGPAVGGALINVLGWRSIFLMAVPFCIIGIIGAWFVLKDTAAAVNDQTDWAGIFTFGLGLTALLIALSEGQSWGWQSTPTLALFLFTLLSWLFFVFIELRIEKPLFNFQLLTYRKYTTGLGITLNYCIGYFAITFLLTIYLQGALQLNPLDSGLLLLPLSVPQLLLGPLGGKLADHFGPLRQLFIGTLVLILGVLLLGNLGDHLSTPAVVIPLLIISVANGLAWPALAKAILSAVPQEQAGEASGMFYTIYNVGRTVSQVFVLIVVGFSISPDIVSQGLIGIDITQNQAITGAIVQATNAAFRVFIVFFAVVLFLSFFLLRQYQIGKVEN
ncbi:MAG: drug resistance transporter, EmrB/QacA subfamily [Firmicutes bacterium]|nr:drug resistance transporter, EmrB/QacA subfamily [Bacillota bacterium]